MRPTRQAVECASPWHTLGPLRVRRVRYRAGAVQPRHRHEEGTLTLVLAGSIEETSPATTHCAAAGSFAVKPAHAWHANRYGPDGAVLVQLAPSDPERFWDGLSSTYTWRETPAFARAVLSLVDGRGPSAASVEAALWGLLGDTLPPDNVSATRPAWWNDALDLLHADAGSAGVSVAQVAEQVGVHPVHLARVCRRQLGCSVRAYLRWRRVLAAWRACQQEEASLVAVAAGCGFADQAHMTRAFSKVLGISPGRLRKLAGATAGADLESRPDVAWVQDTHPAARRR